MKCIICLRALEVSGECPTKRELKQFGHNLALLRAEVVRVCFDEEHRSSRASVAADAAFLTDDLRGRRLLDMLSAFAQAARYHNLNLVCGEAPDTEDPDQAWAAVEMEILKDHPDLMQSLGSGTGLTNAYARINADLIGHIEQFTRALCRLFTLGPLGDRGKQLTGDLAPFLFLQDRELGASTYPLRSSPSPPPRHTVFPKRDHQ